MGLGFRVQGLGLRVWVSGFRIRLLEEGELIFLRCDLALLERVLIGGVGLRVAAVRRIWHM